MGAVVTGAHGAHRFGPGPLAGVRVVDFGGIASAYGSMILAGLGAEVTLIEGQHGDPLRHAGDVKDGSSPWFAFLGQGKRSIVADLDGDADRARVAEVIAGADIVLDTLGVASLDALDLGYRSAKVSNPGLVWASITPFGLTGPRRNWKGSNVVAWASAGVLGLNGFPDQAPVTPGGPVQLAYHVTSMQAAIAALLAVQARDRPGGLGHGQLVDISMQECCLQLAPETGVTLYLDDQVPRIRSGNRRLLSRPWGHYKCQDGAVGTIVLQPGHWINTAQWIAEVTGNDMFTDEVFHDVTMRAEIAELVDEFFGQVTMTSTKRELFAEGQRRNVPVTPVNTLADLRSDPHLAASGFFETIEHPELGHYDRPGPPLRTNCAWWSLARAPLLGEHS